MIDCLIVMAILCAFFAFIALCVSAIVVPSIFFEKGTKGILKKYIYHAKKLSEVKLGERSPWHDLGYHLDKPDVFICRCFSIVWLLLPLLIITALIFILTTFIGLMIIGGTVAIIACIWGIDKGTQKAIRFLGNLDDSKLAKFCSNVNKVVNEVKDSE